MQRLATILSAVVIAIAAITALPACDGGADAGEGEGE